MSDEERIDRAYRDGFDLACNIFYSGMTEGVHGNRISDEAIKAVEERRAALNAAILKNRPYMGDYDRAMRTNRHHTDRTAALFEALETMVNQQCGCECVACLRSRAALAKALPAALQSPNTSPKQTGTQGGTE